MSAQLQVTGEAKIRDIQGPVVANSGVITALDGAASQYVRGDGTLADFPTTGGGGSSVSYYLNSSVSQGTLGGVAYRELSKDPITGAGTDIAISSNGYVANYITDANDPDVVSIPGGNFNCEFYFSVNNNTGAPYTYAELYKYDGTTFTLLGSSVGVPEYINQGTIIAPYYFAIPVPTSALALTDRLAIRIYVNVDGRTVTLHTENSHLCQVVTTLSKGMTSLNNLTDQSQYLTTGTSGTNFAIVSTGDTHTFNLPVASASNTGKLSSTDWTTFNNKQNTITDPITGTGASGQIAYFNSGTSITSEAAFNYDASTNRLGVNTSVPNATIGANAGIDSGYSLLLKSDNANYNGIGFGTDSTYGNLISTEKLGTALARNLTLLNQSGFVSLTEAGNLGLGLLTPNTGLDIYNGSNAYLWLHTATSGVSGTDGVRLALFSTNGANLRNFDGSFSITAEGDFSIITIGAENFRVNSSDGSIYQSKVANAMLKSVSGVITAAVAGTDYLAPASISGTTNTIPKFTSSSALGNSNITDTGSLITLGSTSYVSSGNFGVGTSSPSVSGVGIDIYSATSSSLRLHTATSGTTVSDGAGINFSAANNLGITNYENGTIDIVTNGNSGVYIASNGYVGINGATPSVALTVSGSINQTSVTSSLLKTNSSGTLIAAVAGTDYLTPSAISGTTNNLVKFTSSTTIGDSLFSDNGTNGAFGGANYSSGTGVRTFNITSSKYAGLAFWTESGYTADIFSYFSNGNLLIQADPQNIMSDSNLFLSVDGNTIGTFNNTNVTLSRALSGTSATFSDVVNLASTGNQTKISWLGYNNAYTKITSDVGFDATYNGTYINNNTNAAGNAQGNTAIPSWTLALGGNDSFIVRRSPAGSFTFSNLFNVASNGDTTITGVAPILAIQSNTTGNIFLRFRQSADTMASMFYTNATATFTMSNNMGGLRFNTSGTSDAMNITSGGNVGIGTSSPVDYTNYRSLHISGATSTSSAILYLTNSTSSIRGLFFAEGSASRVTIGSQSNHDFTFLTNDTERMRIASGGAVSIGTTVGARTLNVAYSIGVRANLTGTEQEIFNVGNTGSGVNDGYMRLSDNGTPKVLIAANNARGGDTYFNGGGNVAIGTDSPSYKLHVNGTAYATGAAGALSDIRHKNNVLNISEGLNAVLLLRPVSYLWNDDYVTDNGMKGLHFGFIAQEVKEILPDVILEQNNEEKTLGLKYNEIIPVLVKAIQELEARIKQLENK
jgi:hypothetical protein